ncbi:MAG: UDP-N-acetylmuramate dehydrogenase [Nocardioidaceae bacterium]|nr:UDP-N-acetylmuramate dehydrogenase [Nocardioidaceae bacterium]
MLTRLDEPLAGWTTLRLGGPASRFLDVESRSELYDVVARADADEEPALVMGGGSNLVVADAGFTGTVVRVVTRGVVVSEEADSASGVTVTVEAGEDWDGLVERAVAAGWVGVEALSGIPGTVGAVPIQNVGAYGQEVSETLAQVHVFDRAARLERTLTFEECGFGYRTSRFKRDPGRFVVGAVTFQFPPGRLAGRLAYAELARRLGVEIGARVPASEVRRAVLDLRRSKGMVLDEADHDTWSAGSFFTNPFVAPAAVPAGAPAYPQPDGLVKTSAGWLIERAGLAKGYGNSRVSLSTKHALALTNRGGATTADLLELAAEVRDRVDSAFAIRLEPEPTLVNCFL